MVVGALVDGAELSTALDAAEDRLRQAHSHDSTLSAVQAGRALGARDLPTPEQVEGLGGGWVGEEALAIAVACAVGGLDRPVETMLAAVNHSGDSDSTGAIAGNILGAARGAGWLPEAWLEELELRQVIEQMAEDYHRAFYGDSPVDEPASAAAEWQRRYPGW